MADGFGIVMAEIDVGGVKFKGGKIFVIITALTTAGGVLWGGFEFYKDYLDMKEQIQNYTAPDLSGFDKRIDLVQQEVEMMQSEMTMILDEVSLVSDVAKELIARDLKNAISEIQDDMKALEEKTDKQIKKALDNPLSKM
jgi:hypothetical protein